MRFSSLIVIAILTTFSLNGCGGDDSSSSIGGEKSITANSKESENLSSGDDDDSMDENDSGDLSKTNAQIQIVPDKTNLFTPIPKQPTTTTQLNGNDNKASNLPGQHLAPAPIPSNGLNSAGSGPTPGRAPALGNGVNPVPGPAPIPPNGLNPAGSGPTPGRAPALGPVTGVNVVPGPAPIPPNGLNPASGPTPGGPVTPIRVNPPPPSPPPPPDYSSVPYPVSEAIRLILAGQQGVEDDLGAGLTEQEIDTDRGQKCRPNQDLPEYDYIDPSISQDFMVIESAPTESIPVGDAVEQLLATSSILPLRTRAENVYLALVNFLTNVNDGNRYAINWLNFRGPELLQNFMSSTATINCSSLNSGFPSLCYVLMSLATEIPIPDRWTPAQVSERIGLDRFCTQYEAQLKIEMNYVKDLPIGPGLPDIDKRMRRGFLSKWLSFCPNLGNNDAAIRITAFDRALEILRETDIDGDNPDFADTNRDNLWNEVRERYLPSRSSARLRRNPNHVTFLGETGQDDGGLRADWFSSVSREIFDPNNGIFQFFLSGSGYVKLAGSTDDIEKFADAGKFIASMVANKRLLPYYIEIPIWARLMHRIVSWKSTGTYDREACHQRSGFYRTRPVAGSPHLTSLNLPDDVPEIWPASSNDRSKLLDIGVSLELCDDSQEQFEAFARGFHYVLPLEFLQRSGIRTADLRTMMYGAPEIDVDDWIANWDVEVDPADFFRYENARIDVSSFTNRWNLDFGARLTYRRFPQLAFFRSVLESWSRNGDAGQTDLRRLVECVTGNSQIPSGGFAALAQRFKVKQAGFARPGLIPIARTCFHTIEIFPCFSEAEMRDLLRVLLRFCPGEFGLT